MTIQVDDDGTPHRFSLLGIISGLMVSDNMGDVHEEINHLHDLVGLPHPQGDFLMGWTDQDWANIRQPRGE